MNTTPILLFVVLILAVLVGLVGTMLSGADAGAILDFTFMEGTK